MTEAPSAPGAALRGREKSSGEPSCYGALDLGTNNCRLLIATPQGASGFRVVEAYSRIVRLGEGLAASGRLSDDAMERALAALKVAAEKLRRRRVVRLRAIATQACRIAENGQAFLDRVFEETGLRLQIIPPQEEARLSVAGCLNLIDRSTDAALVVDVGGGSTELSWVDLKGAPPSGMPPLRAWLSVPMGVVTLAERFPEGEIATEAWFRSMVDTVKAEIAAFDRADSLREVFDADRAHLIGTSGAITSLAGLHLELPRYDRSRVDGIWMSRDDCEAAAGRLLSLNARERADQPCIGPDRADLVLAGAAILQAVQELWPCSRVRVADRGLREGILLSLMAERSGGGRRRRRRRGGQRLAAAQAAE
ncbi:Ppx/GppA phosphatase family protein [Phenylobacterium sp.]|uniref:Ppx/GppA phosphatase family protein n=1 Tax=Phenylobacterium sp. TaxID=1871053 RepID=UPI00122A5A1A|nr:Ppx/GppA phosphatase family protein [Phenylobacterium sp.]THD63933.1 MAG: Ppx/GppA family phosphatase [Phenylobacterium sp.]